MGDGSPIAVIGMAVRFPAASSVDEYWQNLVAGRDCLSTLSDDELLAWGELPQNLSDPTYVRRRPRLEGADTFDAALFGMTPREAQLHDPQHRIFLEAAHAALEHGGYDPATFAGDIGVYGGGNINRYRYDNLERDPRLVHSVGQMALSIGGSPDYLTTYVSYKLGLRGPSMSVLTACSTSLVAVHVACNAIRAGECDVAIAGGVDVQYPLNLGYHHFVGDVTAPDGVPRPFDQNAAGTCFGDGAGVVLLKSLASAVADGDTVYAVIRGSAINNDGDRKAGFTAPSIVGQSECVQRALRNAGVDPCDITYVEAHATATPVGDPIELAALIDAYQAVADGPMPNQYCDIGSVKSNIGHLSQAAGIAGLIKTVLALWHEQLPPSIHVDTPNPATDWENSPFRVVTGHKPWPRVPGVPRIAGVSSLGIGGTNSHVIVQEPPTPAEPARGLAPATAAGRSAEAVLWSTLDQTGAQQQQDRLAAYFEQLPEEMFGDAAHTLRVGRTARPVRRAVVASGSREAAAALREPGRIIRGDGVDRSIVFAFPGQGAQHPGMMRALYAGEPVFRRGVDVALERLTELVEVDLREAWIAGDPDTLARTLVAQPLLFALEYTFAHCLLRWGLRPRTAFGHSLGELTAAAVAGVFDFESALRAVASRARLMETAPPGAMLAVAEAPDAAAGFVTGPCEIAAINGERQIVLAGPVPELDELAERCRREGVPVRRLRTSHAFHTQAMAAAAQQWETELSALVLHEPWLEIVSSATGQAVTDEQAGSPAFWASQLVQPVNFHAAAAAVLAAGPATVVEVGPGRTMSSLLQGRADLRAHQSRARSPMPSQGEHRLEELLAELWVGGASLRYWHDLPGYRRIAAPGYPYQRSRHWVGPAPVTVPVSGEFQPPAPPEADSHSGPELAPVPATEVFAAADAGGGARESWALAELEWVRDRAGRGCGTPFPQPRGIAAVAAPADQLPALRSVLGRAGYRTVVLGAEAGWDPSEADAWAAHLRRLERDGSPPDLVVHAALLATPPTLDTQQLDAELDRAVHSLYACARGIVQQIGTGTGRRSGRLLVLGRHMVDVTGGEPVNPAAAAAPALVASFGLEAPELQVYCRDVGDGTPRATLARELAELGAPLAALRGAARWSPRLRELPAGAVGEQSRLRYRGVYLLTGGLGGIGLVVARALADTGLEPRLALLCRSGAPAAGTATAQELAAIEALGAAVEVVTADVADLPSLAAAVAKVEHRFGPVHGVVHAAGIAGGGLFSHRDSTDVRRVLVPKTQGVLNLEAVFADRAELDFLLLFSSQAALAGLYGSGDYAAANAFLDGYARAAVGRERLTVSVQWPAWTVGMTTRSNVGMSVLTGARVDPLPAAGEPALTRSYEPGRAWEFDEHTVGGEGVLPGTVLLELVLLAVRGAGGYGEEQAVALRDVVFVEVLTGAAPKEVRVLLEPRIDQAGFQFRVEGRPVGDEVGWREHAHGTVAPIDSAPEQLANRSSDWLEAEISQRATQAAASGLADWISFGPRWDCVADVWGDERERFAQLWLRAEFHPDLLSHPLHPAMLDAATAILYDAPDGAQCFPFLYQSVQVYAPLTADPVVHARFSEPAGSPPRPIDLDFYDRKTGELLVRVVGFTRRQRLVGIAGGAAEAGSRVRGDLGAPEAGSTAGEPGVGVLTVGDGAAAFLSLLAADLPPVVMVEPPGARLQVAGIRWAEEELTVAVGPVVTTSAPVSVAAAPVATTTANPAAVANSAAAAFSAATAPLALGQPPAATAPATTEAAVAAEPEPEAGSGHIRSILRELWTEALGIKDFGDHDDFFELGGNSLVAVTLVNQIRQRLNVEVGAAVLLQHSTLDTLASALSE